MVNFIIDVYACCEILLFSIVAGRGKRKKIKITEKKVNKCLLRTVQGAYML